LKSFVDAIPTAELEPITDIYTQTDEIDMGFTYKELTIFGSLRKMHKCGPVSMFRKLMNENGGQKGSETASKIKSFFYFYGINRHKSTVLPPSYHMSAYSPDDNRFDLRPIVYNSGWELQFENIDAYVLELEKNVVGIA
jgi:NAD+ synthase (glutamine-hydrolysing)